LVDGTFIVAVTGIVTGAQPQLNVMTPPFATAASSAANVQLPAVPSPTTVVGFETSAGWPPAGTPAVHAPGLPALGVVPQPPSVVGPLVVQGLLAPIEVEPLQVDPLVVDPPDEVRPLVEAVELFASPAEPPPQPPATVHTIPTPRPEIRS
jgi:hypothetical protein